MNLSQVLAEIDTAITSGPQSRPLSMLTYNPDSVTTGSLFVAARRLWVDGHDYIDAVISQGVTAIIAETERPSSCPENIGWAQVPDSEIVLGLAASSFYGHPSRAMQLLAVTGTNGKSTITWILHQIFSTLYDKAGLIGTIAHRFGDIHRKTIFTTPPSSDIHALLAEMAEYGCTHVALEASSHGLDMNRLAGLQISVGGFTNLSRDHLDYHQTMESYQAAKWTLFERYTSKACFHIDDPVGLDFASRFQGEKLTVSIEGNPADIRVIDMKPDLKGCQLSLEILGESLSFFLPLVGTHNVQNALVAMGMSMLAGCSATEVTEALAQISAAPGRLEPVSGKRQVLVDYAHSPDALRNVLRTLKKLSPGKLLCVFGAGGDRDKGKRPRMGKIAEEFADIAIVTSDNPRTENPLSIIREILTGFQYPDQALVEPDRRKAINLAIQGAKDSDVILIAGKGHEDYQIIGKERHHFNDREEAEKALRLL